MRDSLVVCYKQKWILEAILNESDKLHSRLTDSTRFEDRCLKQVAKYISKGKDNYLHRRYITKIIKQEAKIATSKYTNENYITFSEMGTTMDDGEEIDFEPEDVLGNVESEVIVKEMTALLGKDGRRKAVLEAWTIGNTNDKSISSTLGRTLGGNKESHRKFIQRFRNECRELLSAAI